MAELVHANNTVVMLAWLATLPLPANSVGTSLPEVEKWYDTGFVVVGPAVGSGAFGIGANSGSANIYIPERKPVITIDCYAARRNSEKPDLGRANNLAEIILNGAYYPPGTAMPELVLKPGVKPVWLESVFPLSEPRPIPEPATNFARFSLDMAIHWIERLPVG